MIERLLPRTNELFRVLITIEDYIKLNDSLSGLADQHEVIFFLQKEGKMEIFKVRNYEHRRIKEGI